MSTTIAVLTGAGISTSAGIPDFRGPDGVWTKHPDQMNVYDLDLFMSDRKQREYSWRWQKESPVWKAQPGVAHKALAKLEQAGMLNLLATQNFDALWQPDSSTNPSKRHCPNSLTRPSLGRNDLLAAPHNCWGRVTICKFLMALKQFAGSSAKISDGAGHADCSSGRDPYRGTLEDGYSTAGSDRETRLSSSDGPGSLDYARYPGSG